MLKLRYVRVFLSPFLYEQGYGYHTLRKEILLELVSIVALLEKWGEGNGGQSQRA